MAIERAQALERENAAARAELAALRAHPDSTPHPAELQLPELTLALRRASDKLTLAEDALRARTAQFVDMQGATSRAHYAAESAFGVAAAARAREEDALAHERGLTLRLRVVEEEGRLMDRVVREYADLVRTLERRQSLPVSSSSSSSSSSISPPPPPPPPKHSPAPVPASRTHASNGRPLEQQDKSGSSIFGALQEQQAGLYRLAEEFEGVNEALRDEIGRLQVDLEGSRAELDAERKAAEEERLRLSNALAELERLKHDDNAAAKMVSRYMYAPIQSSSALSPPTNKTRVLSLSLSPQEVLPEHNQHASKSARVSHCPARSNDVHAAHATRLGAGGVSHRAAPVRAPARCTGRGDRAARAGDVRPAARDRAAARRRRAGRPTG